MRTEMSPEWARRGRVIAEAMAKARIISLQRLAEKAIEWSGK